MLSRFIYVNGEIYDSASFRSLPEIFLNAGFRIDDTIWFCNGQIPLFDEHLFYLQDQAQTFNLKLPAILLDRVEVQRLWLRLINKNKAFHSGVLKIALIWHDEGLEAIVSLKPFQSDFFEIKPEGLIAAISDSVKFSDNRFCSTGFYSHHFWNAISTSKPKPRTDGFIITNERGEIVEFAGGNLFFVKENTLLTPSPETGCIMPPIRHKLLEAASLIKIKVIETKALNKGNITEMEEAFFVSEEGGIQKLIGIGGKRFTHVTTTEIGRKLNRVLLGR